MRPFLSIVIPYHNDVLELPRLLRSILTSKKSPSVEVIVVDDGSNEHIDEKAIRRMVKGKKVQLRIHRQTNAGPAVARNRGAKLAKGKFIVFLDSDVELFPDTLHNLAKIFIEDPDVVALTGVWVKEQKSYSFFPNFKALRDWSYWINERDKSGYYFLFSTRIASIKKSVFMRLGGFDESYNAALVEDIELTYRIARRYAIIFAPNVRVRHEFETFWPIAKKYFLRAYHWTKLYQKRKKFDPVATTLQEALTSVTGVGTVVFGLISLISLPALPVILASGNSVSSIFYHVSLWQYYLFAGCFLVHLLLIRKFLGFMSAEKGPVFALKGFFMGLVLYCFIFAGAAWGRLKQ